MCEATGKSSVKVRRSGTKHAAAQGFTLLETTIALLVMMFVALGVCALFTYSINYNSGANDRAAALAVAQQQLEQLRSLPFDHALLAQTPNNGATATTICDASAPCYNGTRAYTVDKLIVDQNSVPVSGGGTRVTMKRITVRTAPIGSAVEWARTAVSITTQHTTVLQGPY